MHERNKATKQGRDTCGQRTGLRLRAYKKNNFAVSEEMGRGGGLANRLFIIEISSFTALLHTHTHTVSHVSGIPDAQLERTSPKYVSAPSFFPTRSSARDSRSGRWLHVLNKRRCCNCTRAARSVPM